MNDERLAFEPRPVPGPAPDRSNGNGPKIGAWKRLVLVFTNPTDVFRDITRKPTWAVCLIVTTILALGMETVTMRHIDLEATIRSRMALSHHQITPRQMERIRKNAGRFTYIRPVATAFGVPLVMVVIAAFYFLAMKLAGSEATYLHTFSAFLHASWPAGFTKGILLMILVQRFGRVPAQQLRGVLKSNVAAFLPAGSPHWLYLLGRTFDVFNIWTIVLLILGMSIVGRIDRKKAAAAVGGLWFFYIVVRVGFALVLHR